MTVTNKTSSKDKPLSVKEVFGKLYIALETKDDALTKQMNKAESQFPVLMLAYKLTLARAKVL